MGMQKDIKDFVQSSLICQQAKHDTSLPSSFSKPLSTSLRQLCLTGLRCLLAIFGNNYVSWVV